MVRYAGPRATPSGRTSVLSSIAIALPFIAAIAGSVVLASGGYPPLSAAGAGAAGIVLATMVGVGLVFLHADRDPPPRCEFCRRTIDVDALDPDEPDRWDGEYQLATCPNCARLTHFDVIVPPTPLWWALLALGLPSAAAFGGTLAIAAVYC